MTVTQHRPAELPGQQTLADAYPDLVIPQAERTATITERFASFHEKNPVVYRELRSICLDLVGRGHRRVSIKMAFEVARHSAMRVRSDDGWKLNNDFTALYARLLSSTVPELADVFEFRVRRSA